MIILLLTKNNDIYCKFFYDFMNSQFELVIYCIDKWNKKTFRKSWKLTSTTPIPNESYKNTSYHETLNNHETIYTTLTSNIQSEMANTLQTRERRTPIPTDFSLNPFSASIYLSAAFLGARASPTGSRRAAAAAAIEVAFGRAYIALRRNTSSLSSSPTRMTLCRS